MIAWVETNFYCDTDNLKYDLKELSQIIEFNISRFEIDDGSERRTPKKVVKVYSDTHSEIPKEKSDLVRNWLEKMHWSPDILDVSLNLETDETMNELAIS